MRRIFHENELFFPQMTLDQIAEYERMRMKAYTKRYDAIAVLLSE